DEQVRRARRAFVQYDDDVCAGAVLRVQPQVVRARDVKGEIVVLFGSATDEDAPAGRSEEHTERRTAPRRRALSGLSPCGLARPNRWSGGRRLPEVARSGGPSARLDPLEVEGVYPQRVPQRVGQRSERLQRLLRVRQSSPSDASPLFQSSRAL